jgi:hypothetical protein
MRRDLLRSSFGAGCGPHRQSSGRVELRGMRCRHARDLFFRHLSHAALTRVGVDFPSGILHDHLLKRRPNHSSSLQSSCIAPAMLPRCPSTPGTRWGLACRHPCCPITLHLESSACTSAGNGSAHAHQHLRASADQLNGDLRSMIIAMITSIVVGFEAWTTYTEYMWIIDLPYGRKSCNDPPCCKRSIVFR